MKKIDLIKYGIQGFLIGLLLGLSFAFVLAIGQYNGNIWLDREAFWNVAPVFCVIFAGLCTYTIIDENINR